MININHLNICFVNEIIILSSLPSIISKYVARSPSLGVKNLNIYHVGQTSFLCSVSVPDDVEIVVS